MGYESIEVTDKASDKSESSGVESPSLTEFFDFSSTRFRLVFSNEVKRLARNPLDWC